VVETGDRKILVEGSSYARYLSSGDLLYARAGSLFAVDFDLDTLEVRGKPSLVLQSVSTDIASGAVQFAVSDSGDLVFVPGDLTVTNRGLAWVDRTGQVEEIGLEPGNHFAVRLSPDGRRAAMISGMTRSHDLWMVDLQRTTMSRLTFEGETTLGPWTWDGSRIAFGSSRDQTHSRTFWKASDGSGDAEILADTGYPSFPGSFSPDDRFLALHDLKPDRGSDIVIAPVQEDGESVEFAATRFIEWQPEFSPDARWIAYVSDESGGRYEVYVRAFPGPGGKWQISREGGVEPRWSRAGDAVYYRKESTLLRVPIVTSNGFEIGIAEEISDQLLARQEGGAYDVAEDGRVIFVSSPLEETTREEIAVVLNWAAELETQTP
jgi:Tol biopolymer transport system component